MADGRCRLRAPQIGGDEMCELAARDINRYRVIRRLDIGSVARRMVLDPQLRHRRNDAQIAVILIVVVLEHHSPKVLVRIRS